jgi:hypothetical protein
MATAAFLPRGLRGTVGREVRCMHGESSKHGAPFAYVAVRSKERGDMSKQDSTKSARLLHPRQRLFMLALVHFSGRQAGRQARSLGRYASNFQTSNVASVELCLTDSA